MLPTSSLALVFIVSVTLLVTWSMGMQIRDIPRRIGTWWHERKLRKLDLRERAAEVRKKEAEADQAEETADDGNVKKLFSWLEARGKKSDKDS